MFPFLNEAKFQREIVSDFRGYNHNLRARDGEWLDQRNMSTDYYPVASPRRNRCDVVLPDPPKGKVTGIIWTSEGLLYTEGDDVVVGNHRVTIGLDNRTKQLTLFGIYVIIMPDQKYFNLNKFEGGSINQFTDINGGSFFPCDETGKKITIKLKGPNPPSEPVSGDYWIESSSSSVEFASTADGDILHRYNAEQKFWTVVDSYVAVTHPGIETGFSVGDVPKVTINLAHPPINPFTKILKLWENHAMFKGMAVKEETFKEGNITRRIPEGVYKVFEHDNRLWGCRHIRIEKWTPGEKKGFFNEIRCSAQGDFKNWNAFEGLSTDSYAVSIGMQGMWTGAIAHGGHPMFFKSGGLIKVYGNQPSNFQTVTVPCKGVGVESGLSLSSVNGVLFYMADKGFMAYDGGNPVDLFSVFGDDLYEDAVGAAFDNKYYVSVKDFRGSKRTFFVYDTIRRMWSKEDDLNVSAFTHSPNYLYALVDGKIVQLVGCDKANDVEWFAETHEIGLLSPDQQYVQKVTLKLSADVGTLVRVYTMYDFESEWTMVAETRSHSLRAFTIPIMPARCDHMRIRIEGKGDAKIYSLTTYREDVSDVSGI